MIIRYLLASDNNYEGTLTSLNPSTVYYTR
jgi:hypothetical protein